MDHTTINCGGVNLHVALAGPSEGDPVVLLHGFPEFWSGWRHQIEPLAAAGFRVIVPDQRGYNLSDKPPQVTDYTLDLLAGDILALSRALGYERIRVAGHDWGAAVTWELAEMHPHCLHCAAIINVPHSRVFERALASGNLAQMRKSLYMMAFQPPGLPEKFLRQRDFTPLVNGFLRKSVPGTFTPEDVAAYREAWSQPGALTGMLNWYRATRAGMRKRADRPMPRITVPVSILWGEKDAFVEKSLAQASADLCEEVTLTFFPDAGHFVQHEEPQAISRRLIQFFQQ
ncbi:MAG: alpha/beta hydrolase [Chloroflexi bacterium]|nr:alpha/beta hydrolase [Chloroflexota bacterium]